MRLCSLFVACTLIMTLAAAPEKLGATAARVLLEDSETSTSTTTTTTWAENLDLLEGVDIPSEIAVPAGQKLQGAVRAEGHQHYQFNGTAWVLTNATAKLYGSASGNQVGFHFYLPEVDALGGQPTWEATVSDHLLSAVTARGLVAHPVDPDSITWNLLQATSHYGNSENPLGHVTYVQRIKTRRGLAPSSTEGVNKGDTHSSKYYAIYAFYVQSA